MTWSKASRQSRGYGAEWERTRAEVLRLANGLCQCDRCKGGELRLTVAQEVHHVVSKAEAARRGWTRAQIDHPSNLAAMSHACHLQADAQAQGKTLNPKRRFDARGYPIPEGANPRGGESASFNAISGDRRPVTRARPRFNISDPE